MDLRSIEVSGRIVGQDQPPFIVAELSGNHNQSLQTALAMVDAAADAGVHAVKLQTYTADTMTLDIDGGEFRIDDPGSLWSGYSLYKLYEKAHTPWEWHEPIFEHCRKRSLVAFSTPFDASAVEFLEKLDVPAFKIASFENIDLPLIRRAARTGKPVIISTGMASLAELDEAVRTVRQTGNDNIILLKCTSSYPAAPEAANLVTIPHMRRLFNVQVGLSDHSPGIGAAVAAVVLGASIIEKHFVLARADGGVDAAFSLEPAEMRSLVVETERAWRALGKVSYEATTKERASLKHRRSLYLVRDVKAGEALSNENIRSIRPGLGLPPKFYERVLGKRIKRDAPKGTPLSWDLLE
ncbi:MAG: pseudaminic acid synthase [candidate division Zixibacteria bacterium]|nr:pseudaminic acid synthase [candidate division Zixibacteria bacterium]